jgi:hypothetical protein
MAGQHYERPGVTCGVLQGGVIRDIVQHHGCERQRHVFAQISLFFFVLQKSLSVLWHGS